MALKYVDGGKSSVIFGYEIGGNVVTAKASMEQIAYAFNNWNVGEAEVAEENAALRDSLDPPFPEDGLLSAAGSSEVPMALSGMLRIFQLATGDPNPISTPQPNKIIVAAGTDIADIVADDYFTAVAVVSAGDLTASPITPTNDLAAYTQVLTLTVTPTNTPALTTAANPGVITIAFTVSGVAGSRVLNFDNSELTTPQTAIIPPNATLGNVTTSNWADGDVDIVADVADVAKNPTVGQPGKLHFELSAANAGGFIVIRGLRRTGVSTSDLSLLLQEEEIELDSTGTDATSIKHFHQILDIDILTSARAPVTAGTITITSEPTGFETVFRLNDDEPERLTIEAELAEVPVRYYGMLAQQVIFNLGNPNSIGINWLGTRVDEERTIEGGHTKQLIGSSTRAQNPTEFPFVTRRILPSWGGYLVLDDQALLFEGMTLTFNHGWDFSTGHHAERFQDDVERQTRIIGASFNVYAQYGTASGDIYTNWQEKFRERNGSPVEASAFHFPASGRQYELRVDMPNMLLNAPVPLNVADRGRVQRTVEATAFRTDGAVSADNAVVTFVGEDSWS